jgi:hypothetical protein
VKLEQNNRHAYSQTQTADDRERWSSGGPAEEQTRSKYLWARFWHAGCAENQGFDTALR